MFVVKNEMNYQKKKKKKKFINMICKRYENTTKSICYINRSLFAKER
jgi:hypothetical protein